MSNTLLNSLDNIIKETNNLQVGENKHIEYSWSNNLQERIVQYFYQITENGGENKNKLNELKKLYNNLIYNILELSNENKDKYNYIEIIYKLIAETRDIVNGKGIYSLTYMMISEWAIIGLTYKKYNNFCLKLAQDALENLVKGSNNHPLGSWKDIKYFSNYWREITPYKNILKKDPLFIKIKELVKCQLLEDVKNPNNASLLAKWIPREKSKKFGWLTEELAEDYFNNYLITAKTEEQIEKAKRKCLTKYRILITDINKLLKTPQIDQCNRNWKNINFDKNVTSITLRKQSFAFQNKTKKGEERKHSDLNVIADRQECAKNYINYILECKTGKKNIKSKNISIIDLIKAADNVSIDNNLIEREALNMQWSEQVKVTENVGNMIAMIDTSGSMEDDNLKPLYSAIGLGLRVAEKSQFGKRVLTFSNKPQWVNLDDCKDFVSCVQKIRKAPWGMNTNFMAALDLILDTAIKNNINPEELSKTTLIIFSDMQIDNAIYSSNTQIGTSKEHFEYNLKSLFLRIEEKYREAGLRSKFQKEYKIPHIIFWNLRTTTGFPNLTETKNTSMLSGSNANLLNIFLDKGPKILEEITPWKLLKEALNNKRYNDFDKTIKKNYYKLN